MDIRFKYLSILFILILLILNFKFLQQLKKTENILLENSIKNVMRNHLIIYNRVKINNFYYLCLLL